MLTDASIPDGVNSTRKVKSMQSAPKAVAPVAHTTILKAVNNNQPLANDSDRARALLDRWLDGERSVRDTVRTYDQAEQVPEHIF